MEKWLIVLLFVNTTGAIVYMFLHRHKSYSIGMSLFFLMLPIVGFALYFIPKWIQKVFFDQYYDRDSLVKRLTIRNHIEQVDVQKELNVVPIKDAMVISDNLRKRALLLEQLKKNMFTNYKLLLAAENDNDSESAHYVAAAKMEVYRVQQGKWSQSLADYKKDPDNEKVFTTMMETLKEFLESSLLSKREQNIYKKDYCKLVETRIDLGTITLSSSILTTYLSYLVELKQFHKALNFWDMYREFLRNESCYMKMLSMFYEQRDKTHFDEILNMLRFDGNVVLSAEGMEKLRYWLERK